MTVSPVSVTLTNDAPMWNVVKVAAAEPAAAALDRSGAGAHRVRRDAHVAARLAARRPRHRGHGRARPARQAPARRCSASRARTSPSCVPSSRRPSRAGDGAGPAFDRVEAAGRRGLAAGEGARAPRSRSSPRPSSRSSSPRRSWRRSRSRRAGERPAFTIIAPRDGVVVEKNVAVGQQVDAAQRLAPRDRRSDRRCGSSPTCSRTMSATLAPGARRRSSSAARPSSTGAVEQVSAIVDPDRHTVPVRVQAAEPRRRAAPERLRADPVLRAEPRPGRRCRPRGVMSDGAKSYVYVEEEPGDAQAPRSSSVGSAATARCRCSPASSRRAGRRPGRDPARQPDPARQLMIEALVNELAADAPARASSWR